MPELPEVEAAVRRLRRATIGKVIVGVQLHHASYRRRLSPRQRRSLEGLSVTGVERRGKHQYLQLSDGRRLEAHFRMTGDWSFDHVDDPLPRFARATIDFTDGTRAVLDDPRALGTLALERPGGADLGPEPDDPALTATSLAAVLSRRRASIKVAILDQRVIAGLGNIYAAESLWRARIDPRTCADALSGKQVQALLRAIRAVLARASGTRYADELSARFSVYDRQGRPCRRCGVAIARITQSGRSTYFCPGCQG